MNNYHVSNLTDATPVNLTASQVLCLTELKKCLKAIKATSIVDHRKKKGETLPTKLLRKLGGIKRNELCPCGSNKKFKQCCLKQSRS